ncbi:ferritin-like catalase Nec2 [Rutidosis leptorrhynchoides]|uniref:ferritin-like catalase Nec2 n=1 Tax=Rutidosis leptorrhynchoides TaxID=125765 RepID=UPI003A99E47C
MGQDYDPITPYSRSNVPKADKNILEFALNLEYLEAEFFLYGSTGKGLDHIQPGLAGGGPPPMGARMARLTPLLRNIITQFAFQEVGHLRAIKGKIGGGIPRPLMDLSSKSFAITISKAFGRPLIPPFDPYANDINYMLASYMIPYVGLTGYVGANPKLQSSTAKQLVAGLLGVESGQDAVLRTLLYNRGAEKVAPYGITVAEFTDRISGLRNKLGHAGLKDKGLIVPVTLGVEGKMPGNLLIADTDSLSYGRKPPEILRIVYGSGKEQVPGGFFPSGANGTIAKKYLKSSKY